MADSLGHYITLLPLKESSKGRPLKVQMSFKILALNNVLWIENLPLISEEITCKMTASVVPLCAEPMALQ